MLECKACGGRYEPVLVDGTRYFHACPPIHRARVKRLDGTEAVVDLKDVQPTDTRLGEVFVERPDARDENVKGGDGADATTPKSAGTGTKVVDVEK